MNTRTLVAALAGAVTSFLLGWAVYGMLLMPMMMPHWNTIAGLMRPEAEYQMHWMFISTLCWTWMVAMVFDKWAGIKDIKGGVIGGILLMLPISISTNLSLHSMMFMYNNIGMIVLMDAVGMSVLAGGAGAVIAFVLSKMSK
ncbi:MAG: hypothetical protein JNL32_10900 [Candidatus Kapabacteria bacterium]|nr:hypothetical protein [Candidatus Kapabacteria bacterium]